MQKKLLTILSFALSLILIASCSDHNAIANSDKSFKEEIEVYNDILNEIFDTNFYNQKLKEYNKSTAVFFLFDTLTEIKNTGDIYQETGRRYLKANFEKRQFSTEQINSNQNYRFVRVTKYPKDTIIDEVSHSLREDTITLRKDEWFSGEWINFSRVCFNSDFTKGYLSFNVWCGNLCFSSGSFEVEKISKKWKVIKRYKGAVS